MATMHFHVSNLRARDVVEVENIDLDIEYSKDEILAIMNAYPAFVEAFIGLMKQAAS